MIKNLVSIIIPIDNRAELIIETLESIKNYFPEEDDKEDEV